MTNTTAEATIFASVTRHADCAGWAYLADVREDMDNLLDLTREEQDRLLKTLSRERRLHIAPDSDCKSRTERDHAAAVVIGGQANHLIHLG